MKRKKNKPETADEEILKDERIRLEKMISRAMQDISKRNDAAAMAEVEKDALTFIESLGKYRQPEPAEEPVQPKAKGRVPDHKKKIRTYVLKYRAVGDTFTTEDICFALGRNLGREGYTKRVVSQNLNQLQKQGDIEFNPDDQNWLVKKAINYKTVEKLAIEALTDEKSPGFINAEAIAEKLDIEYDKRLMMRIGRFLGQFAEIHGLKSEIKTKMGTIHYDKRPECVNLAEEIMKWCKDKEGNFRETILTHEAYAQFEDKAEPGQVMQTLLKNGYKLDRRMSNPVQHRFVRKEHYEDYIKNSHTHV
jgi:hypothetical protein